MCKCTIYNLMLSDYRLTLKCCRLTGQQSKIKKKKTTKCTGESMFFFLFNDHSSFPFFVDTILYIVYSTIYIVLPVRSTLLTTLLTSYFAD